VSPATNGDDDAARRTSPLRSGRANSPRIGKSSRSPREKPGVKKEQILDVAVSHFGEYGYEDTKWADVADAVGIGPTALYHYFVSKQHCLYVIMAGALNDFKSRFEVVASSQASWSDSLVRQLVSTFNLTEQEVLRMRVLVAEQGLMANHRSIPREESARALAQSLIRDLEFAWGTFLSRGMHEGIVPEQDPRILTRALLGLYNSIWHWYRPGGALSLNEVGQYYAAAQLRLMGCDINIPAEFFDGIK